MKPKKIPSKSNKKTELERLDDRIKKLKQAVEENKNDDMLKDRLRKLQSIQLNIIKRQVRVLRAFIQYDKENNYFRGEKL